VTRNARENARSAADLGGRGFGDGRDTGCPDLAIRRADGLEAWWAAARCPASSHPRRIGYDTVPSQIMGTNAERRAACERVSAYHQAQLGELLTKVMAAIDRYRAGEIDAYTVDETIHHYHRAAGNSGSSASPAAGAAMPSSSFPRMCLPQPVER
jgi:hypothetical protein